jgi:hypothetical protein
MKIININGWGVVLPELVGAIIGTFRPRPPKQKL